MNWEAMSPLEAHDLTLGTDGSEPNMRFREIAVALASLLIVSVPARSQTLSSRLVINDLRGSYSVAGTALWGTGQGNITVGNIPSSDVKTAYLYWDVLGDASGAPTGANQGMFAGNAISGTLIGTGGQVDQVQSANYSYWADVTAYVSIAGNGIYPLSGFLPTTEGASLVLIWSNINFANRDIVVIDGNGTVNASAGTVASTFSGFNATNPVTGASVAFIVGDGESVRDDLATLGAATIGFGSFDGSDDPSGLQLWDSDNFNNRTSDVPPAATSIQASVIRDTSNGNGDSLVWVASPFSVTSPYPDVSVTLTPQVRVVPRGSNFTMGIHAQSHAMVAVQVTGVVWVYDNLGNFLGGMAGPVNGNFSPGRTTSVNFSRRIPNQGVPPRLIGVPLRVVLRLFRRGTMTIIDDDYVDFVVQ